MMIAMTTLLVGGAWWLVASSQEPEPSPPAAAVATRADGRLTEAAAPSEPATITSPGVSRSLILPQEAVRAQEESSAANDEPIPEQDLRDTSIDDLRLTGDTGPEFERAVKELRAGQLDLEA